MAGNIEFRKSSVRFRRTLLFNDIDNLKFFFQIICNNEPIKTKELHFLMKGMSENVETSVQKRRITQIVYNKN